MPKAYKLFNKCKVSFETPEDGYSYFFGYYDKSPLSKHNEKLLAHRISFDGRDVQDNDIAEIGYFEIVSGNFVKIGETLAWNWQQGSQLQWLPPSYSEDIIYNDIQDGKFVSRIHSLQTGQTRTISFPIYTIHPNGKEALGVNYERHFWCRPGYNYQNISNEKWNIPYHKEDGIYHIDLITEEVTLFISIKEIIDHEPLPEFERNNNWLEHVMYNKSGSHFMFFHRWHSKGIDHSRVYIADSSNSKNIIMLPDVRFYSHYCWKNDMELTIWTMSPTSSPRSMATISEIVTRYAWLKTAIKPLYNIAQILLPNAVKENIRPTSKLITFKGHCYCDYEIVGANVLSGNGHQSWIANKTRLLNDTYQNNNAERTLMIHNVKNEDTICLGKFKSLYNDCTFRCDLHPRMSMDNKFITIDSAHSTNRKILVLSNFDD